MYQVDNNAASMGYPIVLRLLSDVELLNYLILGGTPTPHYKAYLTRDILDVARERGPQWNFYIIGAQGNPKKALHINNVSNIKRNLLLKDPQFWHKVKPEILTMHEAMVCIYIALHMEERHDMIASTSFGSINLVEVEDAWGISLKDPSFKPKLYRRT